ncbi:hypothetical protein UlMin_026535 [Ulmus minor]
MREIRPKNWHKMILEGICLGDNIAVNNMCLTVTQFNTQFFEFTVGLVPKTLRNTSLSGELSNGKHFMQGNVDGTGEIVLMEPGGHSLWVKVKASNELLKYIGSKMLYLLL